MNDTTESKNVNTKTAPDDPVLPDIDDVIDMASAVETDVDPLLEIDWGSDDDAPALSTDTVLIRSGDDVHLRDAVVEALTGIDPHQEEDPDEGLVHLHVSPEPTGEFWAYDAETGVWTGYQQGHVTRLLTDWARRGVYYEALDAKGRTVVKKKKITKSAIDAVISWIRGDRLDDDVQDPTGRLGFRTQTLVYDDRAQTLSLVPHHPHHHLRRAYDFDIDPDILIPGSPGHTALLESEPVRQWRTMLQDMLRSEHGTTEDPTAGQERALMEWIGASILGAQTRLIRRACILQGPAGTGKSTIVSMISSLFDGSEICTSDPSSWGKDFRLISLRGKRLNVLTELGDVEMLSDGAIKSVVHGEQQTDSLKYRDVVSFRPIAAHLWACNRLPRIHGANAAVYDRTMVLQMQTVYRGTESERPQIIHEITGQYRQTIISYAIACVASLIERGGQFALPEPHNRVVRRWYADSDSVVGWLAERTHKAEDTDLVGSWVPKSEAYRDYVDWAKESGMRPVSKSNFRTRIEEAGIESRRRGVDRYGIVMLPAEDLIGAQSDDEFELDNLLDD